jgi:hypothetical protein
MEITGYDFRWPVVFNDDLAVAIREVAVIAICRDDELTRSTARPDNE